MKHLTDQLEVLVWMARGNIVRFPRIKMEALKDIKACWRLGKLEQTRWWSKDGVHVEDPVCRLSGMCKARGKVRRLSYAFKD